MSKEYYVISIMKPPRVPFVKVFVTGNDAYIKFMSLEDINVFIEHLQQEADKAFSNGKYTNE